ncbi:MAG: GNAT family N-acetyltransferase [Lewinellaceae bacterium]|nr:GNAT family N-acetyltransferase [Saprospiraceae bacterium]MCB9307458.1 GNAT family N-acetyltransferase [Lewinellaceae bacterium]
MSHREQYTRFCATAPDMPLFMQPWYLDAVCTEGAWDVVMVEQAGRIVAALPFFLKKKWHWQYVAMPPLARMMGPYVLPEWRSPRKEVSLLEALLNELPTDLAAFEQDCHYQFTNWLPFYWRGFRQTTRYSYTLDITDLNVVWDNIAADYRNQKIPKAQELLRVERKDALLDFLDVHDLSYERKGLDPPVTPEFMTRLDEALAAKGQRAIFFAADRSSAEVHSVAYLAWDAQTAWYLMAGDDPALRQSGGGVLIAWEAIRYAREVLKLPVFDFAGSMIRPVERVRRQFGAVQKPYFRLQREWSPLWKLGKALLRS